MPGSQAVLTSLACDVLHPSEEGVGGEGLESSANLALALQGPAICAFQGG